MTKEEATELGKTNFWEHLDYRQRALFQMVTADGMLCMPFDVFHEALEKALGRPVWTHEMGLNWEGLKEELLYGNQPPTFEEILNLIPEGKRILFVTTGGEDA